MKLVEDLLVLELQLLLVGQVLPLAASANTEMLAERNRAYLTIFYKAHYVALGKRVFLPTYLHVDNIAGHAERYKDNQLVPVEQAFSFSSYCFDGHVFKYG